MCYMLQFTEWKTQLEKSTASSFVLHEGAKTKKEKKYMHFYCHRSGQSCRKSKPSNTRARAVKRQGMF